MDALFPLPEAKLRASLQERRHVVRTADHEHAVVECVDAGLLEQWLGGGAAGDELAVGEGVGDEVARRRLVGQQCAQPSGEGSTATASKSTDGPPFELLVGGEPAAVAQPRRRRPSARRASSIAPSAFTAPFRAASSVRVDAVGDQRAELAARESSSARC